MMAKAMALAIAKGMPFAMPIRIRLRLISLRKEISIYCRHSKDLSVDEEI
jgi:hypothetical protein